MGEIEEVNEEIVHNFLTNRLNIPDWREKVKGNKVEFLKELVMAHQSNVCFQNATWAAVPKEQRKEPTISQAIELGINGPGAMCFPLSFFFKLILDYIGFDVVAVPVYCPAFSPYRNHVALVVRFNNNDDGGEELYLVDIGYAGRPFPKPIPLHNLPYREIIGGFTCEYSFNKEKQIYERLLFDGCPLRGKLPEPSVDYYFDLTPATWNDFPECHHDMFSAQGTATHLDGLLIGGITSRDSVEDYTYAYCHTVHIVEGTGSTFKETNYGSYEAMRPRLKQLFPNLDWAKWAEAVSNAEKMRQAKLAAKNTK